MCSICINFWSFLDEFISLIGPCPFKHLEMKVRMPGMGLKDVGLKHALPKASC